MLHQSAPKNWREEFYLYPPLPFPPSPTAAERCVRFALNAAVIKQTIVYEAKVPLFFRLEAVFMVKTAPEKGQLWQPREARVFDQMTSDQVQNGPEHVLYHHLNSRQNRFWLTRPSCAVWNDNNQVGCGVGMLGLNKHGSSHRQRNREE